MNQTYRTPSLRQVHAYRPEASPPVAQSLDLIIPAFNEEFRIGDTIHSIAQHAPFSSWNVRIIVVDNGSVDATADIVDRTQTAGIEVEVIGCRVQGKGAAVRSGIAYSSAPYVGYCDADLSTPPAAIGQGLQLLEAGWDVVIGSRRCLGASYVLPQPRLRRAGSALFHAAAARLAPEVSDTQCGFKLFRAEVAGTLFGAARINGFAFDVELLARARRDHQYKMIELPIQWTDQQGSTFRPIIDGIHSFRELREVHQALKAHDALKTSDAVAN